MAWWLALLVVWIGVQPWLMWPALTAEVSQRLTLVACCVAAGLAQCLRSFAARGLPSVVVVTVLWAAAVMTGHQWPIIQSGGYFEFFQETALFSDGLLLLLAYTWGVWALRQLPAEGWTWVYRLGLVWLLGNGVYCVAQATGHAWPWLVAHPNKISGFLSTDRALGAVGVFWLPLVWERTRWLAWLPAVFIVLAGKVTTWLGVGVWVLWCWPRLAWCGLPLVGWAAWQLTDGTLALKLVQRAETWTHLLAAIQAHPWVGWGFHPMVELSVRQHVGYVLPGLHSDWLSLAFHGGVPLSLLAMSTWGWLCWRGRQVAPALSASLAALGVMACGQAIISQASITSVVLLGAAWLLSRLEVA